MNKDELPLFVPGSNHSIVIRQMSGRVMGNNRSSYQGLWVWVLSLSFI